MPSSYQKSISSGVRTITQKLQKTQVRKKVNSPRSPSSYLSGVGKYAGVTASKDKLGGDSKRMTEYLKSYIRGEQKTQRKLMKTTAGSSDLHLDSTDSQERGLKLR